MDENQKGRKKEKRIVVRKANKNMAGRDAVRRRALTMRQGCKGQHLRRRAGADDIVWSPRISLRL